MLSAIYLFHFLLIIGSAGTEMIHVSIFSDMPVNTVVLFWGGFFTTFQSEINTEY